MTKASRGKRVRLVPNPKARLFDHNGVRPQYCNLKVVAGCTTTVALHRFGIEVTIMRPDPVTSPEYMHTIRPGLMKIEVLLSLIVMVCVETLSFAQQPKIPDTN